MPLRRQFAAAALAKIYLVRETLAIFACCKRCQASAARNANAQTTIDVTGLTL
ncbi:hypothetical protein DOTSEDRAFT_73124 [Dothistroma septosporum NZE10]|uniref:Uncharacterized protein n=1 Tax=Dothistroma septosporum (strain NZE10 / CBS 128990) TaxID=675120 RepID=N1PHY5_DOTSN|nr:hypothetical protein DOTSEDRAFT_73124 [Dothistroma septosporum NZE10]